MSHVSMQLLVVVRWAKYTKVTESKINILLVGIYGILIDAFITGEAGTWSKS